MTTNIDKLKYEERLFIIKFLTINDPNWTTTFKVNGKVITQSYSGILSDYTKVRVNSEGYYTSIEGDITHGLADDLLIRLFVKNYNETRVFHDRVEAGLVGQT